MNGDNVASKKHRDDDSPKPEYDFTNAVRGKYFRRAIEGTGVIILDSDVAVAFPDSESVNRALRLLIEVAQREARDRLVAEKSEPYVAE